ncbi:phage/plasmid primase, P4 family [Paenibacillus sp. FSL H7-0350]|uniref:DNA primase family protein n=1 Tax=Paenibacillus sp. FSL H7-0350 TaxID=2975345 RepID=UPI003158F6D5
MSKTASELQKKLNKLKGSANTEIVSDKNNKAHVETQLMPLYFINKKFQHAKHSEDMIARYNFVYDGQLLWRYHPDGYYKPDGEAYYRAIGQELLSDSSKRIYINESLYYTQNDRQLLEGQMMNPPSNLINVSNGMLDVLTGQIYPHSPKYLSTYQLPVTYDLNANDPVIHNFVTSVLPEDSHNAFYEMIGYILTNDLHMEKAFMFTGVGSNGKSVAIDMITALLSRENVSNISLQDLDHRFRVAGLEGKLLNAFSDLPQKPIDDTGAFKAIVSNESITIERKNKDPKSFKASTKLLFSANHMVVTPDMSDGYFRRWIIFDFCNKFTDDNRDINLLSKLTTVSALSTLLNLAIQGIHRLHQNKKFTIGESLTKAINQYRINADSVAGFLEANCVLEDGHTLYTKDVYIAYRQWCEDSGLRPVSTIKFSQRLALQKGRKYKQPEHWEGIRWSENSEFPRSPF